MLFVDNDEMLKTWYAQADDTIGGWCVTNVNKPPSKHIIQNNEFNVAQFISEAMARHIAYLHNSWLYNVQRDAMER